MLALSSALSSRTSGAQRTEGELWVREILARNAAKMTSHERLHARVWKILRPVLPADAIVMGDATQIVYTGTFAMPMETERCWYYSGNYCALGPALPMAIGAKIGARHRRVEPGGAAGGETYPVRAQGPPARGRQPPTATRVTQQRPTATR